MPVLPVGSKRDVVNLYGESHWPRNTWPQPPCSPTPELREAQKPDVVPLSKPTKLSIWKKARSPWPRSSVPRRPTFELLLVTRLRLGKLTPVDEPVAFTDSKSPFRVP